MKGAILGDIIGSVYEFHTIKQKQFKLFKPNCFFTDDTVMTCAVTKATIEYLKDKSIENFKKNVIKYMRYFYDKYPDAGYGYSFDEWATSDNVEPYGSYGNGGAMRTSSCVYAADSLEEALSLAEAQASVTHNHPEGIKGAQAITACAYMASTGSSKEEIRDYVQKKFYNIDFTVKNTQRKYHYDITAQGSVPQSIVSFLEGDDYEDCIRNAICYGGDTDTMAAMTGTIAEAFYGIPEAYEKQIYAYLPEELFEIIDIFYHEVEKKKLVTVSEDEVEEKNVTFK